MDFNWLPGQFPRDYWGNYNFPSDNGVGVFPNSEPGLPAPPNFYDTNGYNTDETGIPIEPDILPGNDYAPPPGLGVSNNTPFTPPGVNPNGILGYNPYSYGPPSMPGGPVTQSTPGVIDPTTGLPVPGSALSESGAARIYNMQQFPGDSMLSRLMHPGALIKDAAGNLIDATGKIVMSAAKLAAQGLGQVGDLLGQFGNNIMNDPRNTDPAYLSSIGYREGQGTGSLFPGIVTGPTPGRYDGGDYGVGGQGGSFFHGEGVSNAGPRIEPDDRQAVRILGRAQ
jgi:hypothetical protein